MITTPLGYSAVPSGHLAAIVTTLDMRAPPAGVAPPADRDGLLLQRAERPDNHWYRALYRAVGDEWLWTSRLRRSDDELAAIINADGVEIYTLRRDGRDCGLLELDFRVPSECEIVFFGVTPDLVGTGAAHVMMRHAIATSWSRGIARLWLHTCTLDHPRALAFYMRAGFTPIKREVEIFPDPRLDGTIAREAAPLVPIL